MVYNFKPKAMFILHLNIYNHSNVLTIIQIYMYIVKQGC